MIAVRSTKFRILYSWDSGRVIYRSTYVSGPHRVPMHRELDGPVDEKRTESHHRKRASLRFHRTGK